MESLGMTSKILLPARTLLALAIGSVLAARAGAATIVVDSLADGPNAPGAPCTLREAIESVNAGAAAFGCVASGPPFGSDDRIVFAPALAGTLTIAPAQGPLVVTRPLAIAGPGADALTISGNGATGLLRLAADARLSGLTLARGNGVGLPEGGAIAIDGATTVVIADAVFSENASPVHGGAIAVLQPMAALTIERSVFRANEARFGDGGAIDAREPGVLAIRDSRFERNLAWDRGGAVHLVESRAARSHAVIGTGFRDNEAGFEFPPVRRSTVSGVAEIRGGFPLDGGALHVTLNGQGGAVLTIGNANFATNRAPRYGGAIRFGSTAPFGDFARLEIGDSAFDRNEAFLPGYGDGGALYVRNGNLVLRRSTITGNVAADEGGAIYTRAGATLIEDVTIANNRSASWGGALASFCGVTCVDDPRDAGITLRRSTVSGNLANTGGFDPVASGGGFFVFREPFAIENSTFSGNRVLPTWDPPEDAPERLSVAGNGAASVRLAPAGSPPPPPQPPLGGGGAMLVYNVAVGEQPFRLANSTIADNASDTNRRGTGGVWVIGGTRLELASTILSFARGGRNDNSDLVLSPVTDPDESPTLVATRNLIEVPGALGIPCCGNVLNRRADLFPLAMNGGPTATHAIDVSSPAYGAGINLFGFATDQRGPGFPRTIDLRTDIGAYQAPTGSTLALPVPVLDRIGLALMALAIGAAAWLALARRRRAVGPARR
jgi:CSLREA domain-containing protein